MSKIGKLFATGPVVGATLREEGQLFDDVYSMEHGDITLGTADYAGAGMLGTTNLPATGQVESNELVASFRGESSQNAALQRPGTHNFIVNAVQDFLDVATGDIAQRHVQKIFKCVFKAYSPGTVETPNIIEGSATYEITRFEQLVDGVQTVLIDKVNYIYQIDGEDVMADISSML